MAYIDSTDMEDRFGLVELVQLTDRANTGDVDDLILQRAMDDAEAEANSYLRGRYAIPVSPVDGMLRAAVADMARYRLYDEQATEQVTERYNRAVRWLQDVARGLVNLDAFDHSSAGTGVALVDIRSTPSMYGRANDY
jgi:phage gp36-like protein